MSTGNKTRTNEGQGSPIVLDSLYGVSIVETNCAFRNVTTEPWQVTKARELLAELPGLKQEELPEWNEKAKTLIAFSGALISEASNRDEKAKTKT